MHSAQWSLTIDQTNLTKRWQSGEAGQFAILDAMRYDQPSERLFEDLYLLAVVNLYRSIEFQ